MKDTDKSVWDKASIIAGIAIPVFIFLYGLQQNAANNAASAREKIVSTQNQILAAENAVFAQLWEDFANEVHQKTAFEFARCYSDSIRKIYAKTPEADHIKDMFSPLKTAANIIERAKVEENKADDNVTKNVVTEKNVRMMDSNNHTDTRQLITFIQYSNKECRLAITAFTKVPARNDVYRFQKLDHVVGGFKNEVRYYSPADKDKAMALALELKNAFGTNIIVKHITWLKSDYHALEVWLNDEICK